MEDDAQAAAVRQLHLSRTLVKNTFLDIVPDMPDEAPALVRSKTAPDRERPDYDAEREAAAAEVAAAAEGEGEGEEEPEGLEDIPMPTVMYRGTTYNEWEPSGEWDSPTATAQPAMPYTGPVEPTPVVPYSGMQMPTGQMIDTPAYFYMMPVLMPVGTFVGGAPAPVPSQPAAADAASSTAPAAPAATASSGAVSLPPPPQQLTRAVSAVSQKLRIHWTMDARKLRGNDKVAVSPPFEVSLGDGAFADVTFKIMVYPRLVSDGRGGASFRKSKGFGQIQVKCEAELQEAQDGWLRFWVKVGNQSMPIDQWQKRGPFTHDFKQNGVGGLPKDQEEWNFEQCVDKATNTFLIVLELDSERRM